MKTLQLTLFSECAVFGHERFEESIEKSGLAECIRIGVLRGLSDANRRIPIGEFSFRLHSDTLHEAVYNGIQAALSEMPPGLRVDFIENRYGNERLFFIYDNYAFIVCKARTSKNDNRQCQHIADQRFTVPVISITYQLDEFREQVVAIELQYSKGGDVLYTYSINPMSEYRFAPSVIPVERGRLRLKQTKGIGNDGI